VTDFTQGEIQPDDKALVEELCTDASMHRKWAETANQHYRFHQLHSLYRDESRIENRSDYQRTLDECKRWESAASRILALTEEVGELAQGLADIGLRSNKLEAELTKAQAVLKEIREVCHGAPGAGPFSISNAIFALLDKGDKP
jgi:NTP pyrophosphatase (non-canonical NTP hydrolase)